MKLSSQTVEILKNFSQHNTGLIIREGSELRTASPLNTVLAIAKVSETFTQQAAIYDLSRLMGVLSMFEDPDVEFGKTSLTVSADKTKVRYVYADENMITQPRTTDPKLNKVAGFQILESSLTKALKASQIMGLPDMCFEATDGNLTVVLRNKKIPNSNEFRVIVSESMADSVFSIYLTVDKLKLLPESYDVEIHKTPKGRFAVLFDSTKLDSSAIPVQYWLTSERDSSMTE